MNERIDVLALQATDRKGGLDRHKFAELIVRECAEVARSNTRVDSKVYLMIQEHFGVE
jgi:RNase P/RNase MRP subunit p30